MVMGITQEEIAQLEAHCGSDATSVLVEGDDPLLLVDPAYVYITRAAHHQLFCVGYADGAVGRREHVALCDPGQLLTGIEPASAALLLSGIAGSQVLRIPTRRFFEARRDPQLKAVVEKLFDDFIELLIGTLPSAPVPTRCEELTPGSTPADTTMPMRAKEGLVWVEADKPPSTYGGIDVSAETDAPLVWPITTSTWVAGASSSTAHASAELLEREPDAAFAAAFYAFVVAFLARQRVQIEEARLERDAASREAESQFVSDSLRQLALVGRGQRLAPDIGRGEAFEMACKKIAVWLEVPIPPIPLPKGNSLSHMQAALSRLTGLRTRKVLLDEDWHKNDAGALLGFLMGEEEDAGLKPVALLPTRSGYLLDDPRKETQETVTDAVARQLHPQAYQFYPPLPDRPITPD